MKSIPVILSLLALTACSSVMNDTTHPMKVDAKSSKGEIVKGAQCHLSNDYGKVHFLSGEVVQVRRSSKDLDICCAHPSGLPSNGRAISRVNGGMAGNILFGGGNWGNY